MIKAVIFDMDGVILESADIKTAAFRTLFEHDFPGQTEEIVKYHLQNMGVSRFVKFRHIHESILKRPFSEEDERNTGKRYSQLVLDRVLVAPFVPGALEFLEANHRKYLLFIASGTPDSELSLIVDKRGIAKYFQGIHGSPATKAELVRRVLEETKFEPSEAVFVGDADTDQRAAHECGVHFVARIGTGDEAVKHAKYRMGDLRELEAKLTELERTQP